MENPNKSTKTTMKIGMIALFLNMILVVPRGLNAPLTNPVPIPFYSEHRNTGGESNSTDAVVLPPNVLTYPAYRIPAVSKLYNDQSRLRSKDDGRYVMLRGVCFGPTAKLPPHLPLHSIDDWKRLERFADLMLSCGFTTLRLPFVWAALEPVCDPIAPTFDEQYLANYFQLAKLFTDKGFTIFIDLHQDLVQRAFGGNGIPDWVLQEGSRPFSFLLNTPWWGLNYVLNPHLRRTFTQFWKNDLTNPKNAPPLQNFKVLDRFLDVIERLGLEAAKNEHIIGIEIFNEPHPALIDHKEFEEELLPRFYEAATERIRRSSKDLFVFVAPLSDWNVNLREDKNYHSHLKIDSSIDDRLVFAYHFYDSVLTGLHGLHFGDQKKEEYFEAIYTGVREARSKGLIPFLSEFGTRQNWFSAVARRHMNWHFEAVERSMVHATYWNINLYNTEKERDGFMREDFSLVDENHEPRNLDIATRPYPIASSAEPRTMHFDPKTKVFHLALSGQPLDRDTVLYVPHMIAETSLFPEHYPNGFTLHYSGKLDEVAHAAASGQLHFRLDPNREQHLLTIVPQGSGLAPGHEQGSSVSFL